MSADAREFIDFWIENSVHAAEPHGSAGSEQGVSELVRRCIDMADSQGITREQLEAEVGDLGTYIRGKLQSANDAEQDRRDGHSPG